MTIVLLLVTSLVSVADAEPEPRPRGLAGSWLATDLGTVPGPLAVDGGWMVVRTGGRYGSRALQTTMRKGAHRGGSTHLELDDIGAGGADEVYWRYWLWFDPDFYIRPPARGKLPGPAGLYSSNCRGGRPSTAAAPCWSARTMFSRTYPGPGDPGYPNGPDDVVHLGSYVYDLDSPAGRGSLLLWDDVAQLNQGRWYCIEGRVRMNTPGKADGVIQNWVDGELAFDRDDMRFRRAGERLHVKSFWMDVYHGGKVTSARDNTVRVDDLVLGPERPGCWAHVGEFRDDDGSQHADSIDWLARQGITSGCDGDGTRFCPEDPVTRAQLAAMLQRALDLPAAAPTYADVGGGHPFRRAIGAVAQAGITRGCGDGARFCPDAAVTRAQLAVLLDRALDLPAGAAEFADVDPVGPAARSIGALATAGVTRGCDADGRRFCPDQPVSRGETATLLHRAVAAAADERARAAAAVAAAVPPVGADNEPRYDASVVTPPTRVVPLGSLR